jgi:predicted small lipoprotein YifL
LRDRGTTMGSAVRILLTLVLVLTIGLSACGRRGSLDRPKPTYPEAKADPSTTMSQAPARRLWIDKLIE